MRLLLCLANSAGEVVSIDRLLTEVWAGVVVGPASVYEAVSKPFIFGIRVGLVRSRARGHGLPSPTSLITINSWTRLIWGDATLSRWGNRLYCDVMTLVLGWLRGG
jgi:hypothetical protein